MKTRRKHSAICHPNKVHLSLGLCHSCYQYYNKYKNSDKTNPKLNNLKIIVSDHGKRKENLEILHLKERRERIKRSPDAYIKGRDKALRDRYGININEYNKILEQQNSRCAICGSIPTYPLNVDHDHKTKEIRGLLCSKCNTFVGYIDNNYKLLDKVLKYTKINKK